jgi:type I restriction enzyme S subunit
VKPGWRKATIADVCNVVNGGTPKTDVPAYWGGAHMWITPAEMGGRRDPYVRETERQLTDAGLAATNLLPSHSVILSSRAPIGHLVMNTVPMATNQGCKGLVPKPGVDYKYLYYYLGSIVNLLNDLGTGATFKELSGGKLKEVPIPLPPLHEQQQIVAILDEAFAGLAIAAANAEKNLKNARELFDSYLAFVLSRNDVKWEKRRLPEVARAFGRGKSKHRPRNEPKLYGGPYPFIQTGDVSNADHWLTDYVQTYSEFCLAQSRLWPKGTVCIAIVGATVGETAILDFDACFPDSVIGVVVDEAIADEEYVEYLLQAFKALLKEKGKGTARDNINLGTFESQLFPFPTLREQRLIVDRLNDMSARRRELEDSYNKRLAAISELRQSILQKAFAGELISSSSQAVREAAE